MQTIWTQVIVCITLFHLLINIHSFIWGLHCNTFLGKVDEDINNVQWRSEESAFHIFLGGEIDTKDKKDFLEKTKKAQTCIYRATANSD